MPGSIRRSRPSSGEPRARRWPPRPHRVVIDGRIQLGEQAGPGSRGGGRRGCHGTAATAARRGRRGAARGRPGRAARPVTRNVGACPPRRGGRTFRWSAVRRNGAGGGGCGAAGRARRRRGRGIRGESDGQARGRGPVALRLARAPTTCRRRAWDGQRVAPVVPPAGAEVVPAGTTTGERGTGVPLGSDRPVRRVLPDSGARRGRLPHARLRVAHGWHRGGCRGRNSRLPLPSREQPFKTTRPTSSPAAARPDLGLGRPAGDPSGRPRAP